ncbi:AMP-binding enzyme, partial [Rhizoctonia solani AG-3 Rhs1AP]
MSPDSSTSLHGLYSGPNENDSLTEDELTLLLATPRAAASTPNAILFRLPLGPEPSMGWVDVTCAEAHSIVARLADAWRSKLSNLLSKPEDPGSGSSIGPGTTICITVEPSFHGIFHLLAFWAIGCTVQFVSIADIGVAVDQLDESGCRVMLCSGFDDGWMKARRTEFSGAIVQLPEEEQAHNLAKAEKQRQGIVSSTRALFEQTEVLDSTPPPWPTPRRPTPALILQSSGTTGRPKLLRLSLYHYTIGHGDGCRAYLASARPEKTSKTPFTHPRLVPVPFYWSSTFYYMFVHLTTATPMAFAYFTNILAFTPSELIDWAIAFNVGAIGCSSGIVRRIPNAAFESNAEFLRSLFLFSFTGSAVDEAQSQLFEELQLPIMNLYGSSELGRVLHASKAPYTHLRLFRGTPPPLVHPISEYAPDGSRHVELWFTPKTSPRLAHHHAHGGVLVKFEAFPGDGPHKGELAINTGDIFRELTIHDNSGSGSETVYTYVGRHSDQIRLGGKAYGNIDAALFEMTLGSEINARLGRSGSYPWTLDGIQLFGNNMSSTALVIQLCLDQNLVAPDATVNDLPVHELHESVEETNNALGFTKRRRVNVAKRMLIRTPKRWENVCKFKPWLDGLDFEDSDFEDSECNDP